MHICVEVWHCSTHFENSSLVLLVLFATSLILVFSALSDHYGTCRQHDQDYKVKRDESELWKHCVSVHNGELQVFKISVVESETGIYF